MNYAFNKCEFNSLLLTLQFVLFSYGAFAQQRTVENAKMIGVGVESLQDTYLSPLHYSGPQLRYVSQTQRTTEGKTLYRVIENEGSMASSNSKPGNGGMLSGTYRFGYSVLRQIADNDDFTFGVGGQASLTLGFIYNTRGGNNEAQARAALNVGPSLHASYAISNITLNGLVSTPLVGVCFSPNYGQSYYEIFTLGNYDHNVVPTTVFATPSLRVQFTADFDFLNTRWRVGWLGDFHQQNANNLKQHVYSNSLLIGFVM